MTLVGREHHLRTLQDAASHAAGGNGGCVELVGPAGAGKSAIIEAFREWASAQGFRIAVSAVTEWEREFPWATFTALMAPFVQHLSPATDPDDAALAELVLRGENRDSLDPFRMALTALRSLSGAADERPLALIIDDLHWADDSSLEALALLSRRISNERIVVIAARRAAASDFRPWGVSLSVEPLSEPEIDELLRQTVSDQVLRRRIAAVAGGLPLVAVVTAAALTPAQRSGDARAPESLPVATVVGQWYAPMLRQLDTNAAMAALIAAAEPHGSLATVIAALDNLGLGTAQLEAAERVGLLGTDGLVVRFAHPTAREAVYGSATAAHRRHAHQALADVHEHHDNAEWVWHRLRALAGTDEPTAEAATLAAHRAVSQGAHLHAAELFRRAARCTPASHPSGDRWLAAATAATAAGDLTAAIDDLDHATRHHAAHGGVAMLRTRLLAAKGDADAAFDAARLGAPEVASTDLESALHLATEPIGVLLQMNRRDQVIVLAELAESLVPPEAMHAAAPTTPGEARVWIAHGVRCFLEQRHEEGAQYLEAWRHLLEMVGPTEAAHYLCQTASVVYSYTNRRAQAVTMLDTLLSECRLQQAGGAAASVLGALAAAHYGNDFVKCVEAGEEMMQLMGDPRQRALTISGLSAMAFAAAACGDQARCEAAAAELHARGDSLSAHAALAKMALFAGDPAAALDHLELAESDERARTTHHRWQNDYAEAFVQLGRFSEAQLQAKRLVENASPHDHWAAGQSLRVRALMADGDEAAELFRRSTEHLEQNRNHYPLAIAYFQWGRFVRRQRRRAEARRHLERARDLFAECGATGWVDKCRHEVRATGGRHDAADTDLNALTTVELSVAQLIAAGASNREIGGQLFISPRTVESHITSIYRKLGIKGRTAIAAWVRSR